MKPELKICLCYGCSACRIVSFNCVGLVWVVYYVFCTVLEIDTLSLESATLSHKALGTSNCSLPKKTKGQKTQASMAAGHSGHEIKLSIIDQIQPIMARFLWRPKTKRTERLYLVADPYRRRVCL